MRLRMISELGLGERQQCLQAIECLNQRLAASVTIANDPCLFEVVSQTFGYEVDIAIFEVDGQLVGYFMFAIVGRRLVSLPHFSYAGFLAEPAHQSAVQARLLGDLAARGASFLFRGDLVGAPFHYESKCTYLIHLPENPNTLLKSFKSKQRYKINKAKGYGIEIMIGGVELCESFFDVYSRNMHRLGSPCLPQKLFLNLLKSSMNGNRRIYIAKLGDTTIGVAFVIEYQGFCEVCWASTRQEHNHMRPNMLLYWAMLEDAIARGCQVFSFGRSTQGSSTEEFKLQWNPKIIRLNWSSSTPIGLVGRSANTLTSLWKLLPYQLTISLGALVTHYIC